MSKKFGQHITVFCFRHIKKMERPKQPFIPTHSGFGTLEALAIFDFMNFGKQTNTAGKDPIEGYW